MSDKLPVANRRPLSVPTGKEALALFDLGLTCYDEPPEPLRSGGELSVVKAGARVGRYQLVRELGEGGFGVVWLAQQTEPIQREVAIKLIKPGMDSRRVIARFEAERQTLAIMEHPNIAAVLDAGATAQGHPYFVMELVRGEPITTYCDRRSLTVRQRLELFIEVCHGIQHAHQKAILHRDLKPSNILVDDRDGVPVPKIIDFGIAKALAGSPNGESSMFTGSVVVGTPQYMSPEQAGNRLDVDVCSDIYSLGAILFELLTGRPPFSSDDLAHVPMHRVLQVIHEADAVRPSTVILNALGTPGIQLIADTRRIEPRKLGMELRGDLDWIVLKALEKERGRRYESASAFAADIQRHLQHEPVTASPPTRIYILKKFVRRNRVSVSAGMLVALALLGGATAAWWGYLGQEQALKQSRQTEALRRKQVKKSARFAGFMGDMFRDISRRTSSSLTPEAVRGLFDSADELRGSQFWQDAETDMRVSLVLAQGYCELNQLDVAEKLFQNALAHLQQLGKDDSMDAAECRFWIVWVHLRRLDENGVASPESLCGEDEMLKRCLEVRAGNLPPGDPVLLRTQALQIGLHRIRGDLEQASELLDSLLGGSKPGAIRGSPGYGWLLREKALLSLARGKFSETLSDLGQARKILTYGATNNQKRQMEADDYRIECAIAIKTGKLDEAEDTAIAELNSRQLWLGYEDPRVLTSIAEIYVSMERFADAEPRLQRSVEISRSLSSAGDQERALRVLVKYQDRFYSENLPAQIKNVTALARLVLKRADDARAAGRANAAGLQEVAGVLGNVKAVPEPYPPEAAGFFDTRASLAARRSRFAEAIGDLGRAAIAEPGNNLYSFKAVTLHLAAGDEKAYETDRERLFAQLDGQPTSENVIWICRSVLLRPGAGRTALQKLRDRLSRADLQSARPDDDWAALLQGMARYRAGDYQDAADWLDLAQRSGDPTVVLQAQFLIAINQLHLRQPGARVMLRQALEGFAARYSRFEGTDSTPPMHDYLAVKFLKEEAQRAFAQP